MAKYTTQVRSICEVYAGLEESKGFNDIDDIISEAKDKIFGNYPIFDEAYRSVLNTKILKHYYMREIGMETVGLWKHFLNTRMNEIMPYYNKLYESELLEFNPLYDVDYTKSGNRDGQKSGVENETAISNSNDKTTGTISDTGTGESLRIDNLKTVSTDGGTQKTVEQNAIKNDRWDYYNDTPQGSIQNLADLTYLTNARHITDDGTGSTSDETTTFGKNNTETNTGNVINEQKDDNIRTYNTDLAKTLQDKTNKDTELNTTEQYTEHIAGKIGKESYAKILLEFRESFLNIDMLIIRDLGDLFFGLWE